MYVIFCSLCLHVCVCVCVCFEGDITCTSSLIIIMYWMVNTDSWFLKKEKCLIQSNYVGGAIYIIDWLQKCVADLTLGHMKENIKIIFMLNIFASYLVFKIQKKKNNMSQSQIGLHSLCSPYLTGIYLPKPKKYECKYWLECSWLLPLLSAILCILLRANCFKLYSSILKSWKQYFKIR